MAAHKTDARQRYLLLSNKCLCYVKMLFNYHAVGVNSAVESHVVTSSSPSLPSFPLMHLRDSLCGTCSNHMTQPNTCGSGDDVLTRLIEGVLLLCHFAPHENAAHQRSRFIVECWITIIACIFAVHSAYSALQSRRQTCIASSRIGTLFAACVCICYIFIICWRRANWKGSTRVGCAFFAKRDQRERMRALLTRDESIRNMTSTPPGRDGKSGCLQWVVSVYVCVFVRAYTWFSFIDHTRFAAIG